MEERINVAELLKDCPKGMELDCILYDNIYFDTVGHNTIKCYIQNKGYRTSITFDFYGGLIDSIPTKCVIFPKGKTTWKGFAPPCKFKDGDIVINASNQYSNAFIYAGESNYYYYSYIGLTTGDSPELSTDKSIAWVSKKSRIRFATEKEKEKLFDAIKENGYKWNTETKTLEKLVQPRFKVGDVIQDIDSYKVKITEVNIEDECYGYESMIAKGIGSIMFSKQDNWKLVTSKFDITTLIPFESRVLVRNSYSGFWMPTFWGVYETEKSNEHQYRNYLTTKGFFRHCIPYNDDTKHLVGKTDDCDEYYKTWE